MAGFAKTIIIIGVVLIITGILLLFIQKLPFLGRLPGDVIIKKPNVTFYFPLATSIIISIIISVVLYLIGKFK